MGNSTTEELERIAGLYKHENGSDLWSPAELSRIFKFGNDSEPKFPESSSPVPIQEISANSRKWEILTTPALFLGEFAEMPIVSELPGDGMAAIAELPDNQIPRSG